MFRNIFLKKRGSEYLNFEVGVSPYTTDDVGPVHGALDRVEAEALDNSGNDIMNQLR
jgi:hypothetical protein